MQLFIRWRWGIAMFLVVMFYDVLSAQTSTVFDMTTPAEMYEGSKNAAGMVRVVDVPVSYYNGKAQLNFPLYQIKSGSLEFPLSLDYTAGGGIPVQSQGSWVGTGWECNGSGAIVRTVVGRPDELTTMGYTAAAGTLSMPLWSTLNPYSWLSSLTTCNKKDIGESRLDLLPDIYFVQFGRHSARMFFDRTGAAYFSPYKPWKLSGSITTGFVITTEDGIRYEFNDAETSTYDVETLPGDGGSNFTCKSAWFLSRIVSPNRIDTIRFAYAAASFDNEDDIPSETRYTSVAGQPTGCNNQRPPSESTTRTYSHQTSHSFRLSHITFKSGRVEYVSAMDRSDVNTGNKSRLREINIFSTRGTINSPVKKVRFNQFYASSAASDVLKRRLFLQSFVEVGGTDSMTTGFTYINPDAMPSRRSYALDHWGLYNGKNGNTTLIPAMTEGGVSYSGADREPDSIAMQYGLLSTITYPTGGVRTFTYEPHRYSFFRNAALYKPVRPDSVAVPALVQAKANDGSLPAVYSDTTRFFLPDIPGYAQTITYFLTGLIPADPNATVFVTDDNFNVLWASGTSNGVTRTADIYLQRGRYYRLIAERVGLNEKAIISLNYYKWNYITSPAIYSKIAGGTRLKSITTYDGINHAADQVVSFHYQLNDSTSSGVLLDEAKYAGMTYSAFYCDGIPQAKGGDWQVFARYGNSLVALGRTQGSPIGYSRVVAEYGPNAENGSEVYNYTLRGLMDGGGVGYPYIPRTSYDELRGLLLSKRIYDSAGNLLRSTTNEWDLNNTAGSPNLRWVWGAKCGIQRSSNSFFNGCPTGADWSFSIGMFQTLQYWPTLNASTDSTYDVLTGAGIGMRTVYTYDSVSAQVTSKEVAGSDNVVLRTTYTYPRDYAGTTVYDSMIARNIISEVIGAVTTRGNIKTYEERNDFGFYNGMIAPLGKRMIRSNQALEQRLTFDAFDARGNLLQQGRTTDVKEVYLWGYNGEYPVATITGATYNEVAALVNQSVLDAPADDAALRAELNKIRTAMAGKSVQVITKTFSPYGKVTSETDPAGMTTLYSFNGLGQLIATRDWNGNYQKIYDIKLQVPVNQ
ncbi:RHS repeat domain-containing protein [Chitinophaga rhizophila]|uniref:YD repeat-containing protein n=1 Tax=Chitinophaga rhizophila TaxID=2866212 RepID=A0ABS7GAS5_9BACT|nr:hypothetical protein [Chitinophaga rhizophila]MBW8684773.1 hypothetical protein [Chitinophaga rhizophila]